MAGLDTDREQNVPQSNPMSSDYNSNCRAQNAAARGLLDRLSAV